MIDRPLFFLTLFSLSFFFPAAFSAHEEADKKPQETSCQSWPSVMSLADIPDDATPASLMTFLTKEEPSRDNTGISLTDYHQRRGGFALSSHRDPSPSNLVNALTDLSIHGNPKSEAASSSLSSGPASPKIDPPISSRFPPRVRKTSERLTALTEEP